MFAFSLVLSTIPSFPFPPIEAELLLREMDARINAAKTIRIEFTIDDSHVGKEQRLTQGSLVIADRNRFRYELKGTITANVVSDGKRMVSVFAKPPEKKSQLTPEWFNEVLKSWLGRGGTFVSFGKVLAYAEASVGNQPGEEAGPRVSNARMLPSEDLNGVKARVIEYDLAWPKILADIDAAKVKVWIDLKTKLPLRRTMTLQFGSEEKRYVAIHAKFELNPVLDDKQFELSK